MLSAVGRVEYVLYYTYMSLMQVQLHNRYPVIINYIHIVR